MNDHHRAIAQLDRKLESNRRSFVPIAPLWVLGMTARREGSLLGIVRLS
jgi:hypothetical protein